MCLKIGLFAMIIVMGANINLRTGSITNVNVAHLIAASLNKSGYDIYETDYILENGYKFECIQVRDMDDNELESKINNSLTKHFSILIDPWFGETKTVALEPVIHMQSERYLSVEYIFRFITADNTKYWRLCVTVDMKSGEVIGLDDLIDIDDEFVDLIKNGSILKLEAVGDLYTAEEVTERDNRTFNELDSIQIQNFFLPFTKEYLYGDYYRKNDNYDMVSMSTYLYSKRFYLEEQNICFTSYNNFNTITRIEINSLDNLLKVPKW